MQTELSHSSKSLWWKQSIWWAVILFSVFISYWLVRIELLGCIFGSCGCVVLVTGVVALLYLHHTMCCCHTTLTNIVRVLWLAATQNVLKNLRLTDLSQARFVGYRCGALTNSLSRHFHALHHGGLDEARNYRLTGTETRQIFSRMFVMAKKLKSCLPLL